jgi:flavin reductase (DIM6/NTAB) family NADH-FMN oxidoreductase RutF
MSFVEVSPQEFSVRPFYSFEKQWFALCAGVPGERNVMCCSWGMFGSLWGKPMAQVFVRPTRFSYHLLDRYDTFTMNALPQDLHKTLAKIGAVSGRDLDKFAEFGLTPETSPLVPTPYIAEAERVYLCRRVYSGFLDPNRFEDPKIEGNYPNKDYHKFFVGEILQILEKAGPEGVS